jgi:hypothetical protein
MAANIEEKWDEENNCAYYLDSATGASAWSREELEAVAQGGEGGDGEGGASNVETAKEAAKRAKTEAKAAARKAREGAKAVWDSVAAADQPRVVLLSLTCLFSFVGFCVLSAAPCFPRCGLKSLCVNKLDDNFPAAGGGATPVDARITFSRTFDFAVAACVLTWLWSCCQLTAAVSTTCRPLLQLGSEVRSPRKALALEVVLWVFVSAAWASSLAAEQSSTSNVVVSSDCKDDAPLGFAQPYAVSTPDVCGYFAVWKGPQLAGSGLEELGDLPRLRDICASGKHVSAFIALGFFLWLVMSVMTGTRLYQRLVFTGALLEGGQAGVAPQPPRQGGEGAGGQGGRVGASGGAEGAAVVQLASVSSVRDIRDKANVVLASARARTLVLRLSLVLALFSAISAAAAPCFSSCSLEGSSANPGLGASSSYRWLVIADICAAFWCAGLLALEKPAAQAWLATLTAEAAAGERAAARVTAAAAAAQRGQNRRASAVQTTKRAARRASAALVGLGSSVMTALTPAEQAEFKEVVLHLLLASWTFFAWTACAAALDRGLGYSAIRADASTLTEVCGFHTFLQETPELLVRTITPFIVAVLSVGSYDLVCRSVGALEAAMAFTFFLSILLLALGARRFRRGVGLGRRIFGGLREARAAAKEKKKTQQQQRAASKKAASDISNPISQSRHKKNSSFGLTPSLGDVYGGAHAAAVPGAAPLSACSPPWSAHTDQETGATYFYNAGSGETSWTAPTTTSS